MASLVELLDETGEALHALPVDTAPLEVVQQRWKALADSSHYTPEQREIIARFASTYQHFLENPSSMDATSSSNIIKNGSNEPTVMRTTSSSDTPLSPSAPSSFPIDVLPMNVECPSLPPKDLTSQPFWLMRHLSNILREGGLVTPTIYVPTSIWRMGSTKLTGLADKIQAFESVTERLAALNAIDPENSRTFLKELDVVVGHTSSLQLQLSKTFSFIAPPGESHEHSKSIFGGKFSKFLSRSLSAIGGGKDDELVSAYVTSACGVFDACQMLEGRILHFSNDAAAVHKMQRVCGFCVACVCAMVLRDVEIQLEYFVKTTTKKIYSTTSKNEE